MTELIRQRLAELPARPGCYLMRDRRGVIIYIGKAKNLRRRVSSYFRAGARHPPKVRSMVDTVWDFEFMTVRNEAESLLTEASLIKKYKPHFNILMRDDKRYPALKADTEAEWPRFVRVRIVRDDGARYFGPFPSGRVVSIAKDFVERHYGIRNCACLVPDRDAHSHCSADIIRSCSAPCLGRISQAEYRQRFAEACEFLDGRRQEVLTELETRMRAASAAEKYETAAELRDTVAALRDMTRHNFVRRSPSMRKEAALRGLSELAAAIGLPTLPRTIECYDISNLFGTFSTASLTVARDGLPDRRRYRHFQIKTIVGADDPRSMAEVITRRFTGELAGEGENALSRPDLIICDGGVTQLRAVRAALAALSLAIPTVGLAERQEEIVLDDGRENLLLPRDSEGLFVCTRLRDEAHRFAITHHRKLRDRAIRESALDEIPGIGEAKKTRLLQTFGSLKGIAAAEIAVIAAAAGISTALAGEVKRVAGG